MTYDRLLSLADHAFGSPRRGEFQLELLMALVPDFCDGCAIELFGRNLPPEEAAIWSPFRKILQSDDPVAFGTSFPSDGAASTSGDISQDDAGILRKIGVRSAIGIPLRLEGRLVGSLSVYMASSGRDFSADDFSSFRDVARRLERTVSEEWLEGTQPVKVARGEDLSLLARKLSFGRLERYAAEQELAERRRQQDAVAELAGRVITEPDLKVVLDRVARRVAEVLSLDFVKVAEFDPDGNVLVVRAVTGFPEEHVDRFRIPAERESQAGYTFAEGELVRSDDFEREKRFKVPDIPGFDLRSGMAAVIQGAEQPWGVLEADSVEPRVYTDDEASFLGTVANLLGQAVERSASEVQLRYRATLLDTVAEAVAALDLEGRVVYWNRQAERLFGWTSEEMLGRSVLDVLVLTGERDRVEALRERVIEGRDWAGQMEMTAKDGTSFTTFATSTPVHDAQGAIVGRVVTAIDIQDRLDLEERLRQAQKMEGMGRLAGGVAHDFNNLLTTIAGFTDLQLSEPGCEGPVREFALEIQKATGRATRLTAQLLAFSRRQALLPQVFDPRQLLRGMETLLRRMVGEHIQLDLVLDEEAGRVLADPTQIEQVIMNLVVNARDAMPLGGSLTVSVGSQCPEEPFPVGETELPPGRYAVIAVSDTGSGIPPEVQARVFDPFFTTKVEGGGTGLGLSTVYGIVQQSGGGVIMESEAGSGTTFYVCLPVIEGAIEADRRLDDRRRDAQPIELVIEQGQAGTILVAEDEPSVRALLVRLLPRMGYRVIEASEGAEALERFREHRGRIDVVLTDVIMPIMSGPELAAALHREEPELPILFMSGYTDDMLESHNIRGSGIPLLQKPFTIEQLARYLDEAMSRAR